MRAIQKKVRNSFYVPTYRLSYCRKQLIHSQQPHKEEKFSHKLSKLKAEAKIFAQETKKDFVQRGDPFSLKKFTTLPTWQEKKDFLISQGKNFVTVSWQGLKVFYNNVLTSRKYRPLLKSGNSCSFEEYYLVYQNNQDWKRIVPIVFFWKILPGATLYLPFFLLMYPFLLPSTFDVAKLAQVPSKFVLFDAQIRDKRAYYLRNVHSLSTQQNDALHLLSESPSSDRIIKNSKLFVGDDVKLCIDNLESTLTKPQMKAILLAVGIDSLVLNYLPEFLLKYKIVKHFDHIYKGDKFLSCSNISLLPSDILQQACLERGLRLKSLDTEHLRAQLMEWLRISNYNTVLLQSVFIHAHAYHFIELTLLPDVTEETEET